MKKQTMPRKLKLQKSTVVALSNDQVQIAAGARPPILPPSWFECGFTIWCD